MSLELAVLCSHTPRICHENEVMDYQRQIVEGMHEAGERIESIKPDVLVVVSCHWMSTFNHYVDAAPRHQGNVTALECPDMISNVPYDYPGNLELANKLVQAGREDGLAVVGFSDPIRLGLWHPCSLAILGAEAGYSGHRPVWMLVGQSGRNDTLG